jgi:glucose-6-phosphate 1-dehydrogenase
MDTEKSNITEPSHSVVVFGASGDLASKKIYPTLWALYRDSAIPHGCQIFGYARSKLSVAKLREKCSGTVKAKKGEEELLEQFWAANHYVAGSYDDKKDFELLNQEMASIENKQANRMFYLSLPPSVFKTVTSLLTVLLSPLYLKNLKVNHRLPACPLQAGPELLLKNRLARILPALLT